MSKLGKKARRVGAGGKKSKVHPERNVTPLVDVVLVLLIIFMVLAPVVASSFTANLPPKPEEDAPPPPPIENPDKPMVVKIFEDGHLEAMKNPIDEAVFVDEFSQVLNARDTNAKRKGKNNGRHVYVDAEDPTEFGHVLHAIDLIRQSKASRVVLLTEAIKDKSNTDK